MDNPAKNMSFLDLLDLDEELIDSRLKSIMERNSHSNKQLSNALQLLQYKNLINLQDKTDCENSEEFNFVVKLIKNIHPGLIDNLCKITVSVLNLNTSTLVSNSQHLLQQILSNIDLSARKSNTKDDDADQSKTLPYFKVCDSILDAVIQHGLKVELFFMEVPLEKTVCHPDEKVKIHFITSTVPKLFNGIIGYNILDNIWNYVKELKDIEVSLKVLSCLSGYYLPAVGVKGDIEFESEIVYHCEFWKKTVFGLMSADFTYRKISVYLAKRAIDYIASKQKDIKIQSENDIIFIWDCKRADALREQWNNFFILIDSLEEKQSNIVLPSLQLFDAIGEIHSCWINCAFNLGLKHDNSQVRLKCVEHQLKRKVKSVAEATILIKALDDINFYENNFDVMALKDRVKEMLKDDKCLVHVLEAIPIANLSPVPLFHFTDILAHLDTQVIFNADKNASDIITEIMKVSCNIITLRKAFLINISYFVGKCCKGLNWKTYAKMFSLLQLEIKEIESTKNPLVMLLGNNLTPNEEDTNELLKYATDTLTDIGFGLLYLDKHPEHMNLYLKIMNDKVEHVKNIVNRQYSNKLECLNDVQVILKIFSMCNKSKTIEKELIANVIMQDSKTILHYIHCLLTSDTVLSGDESKSLFYYLKCSDNFVKEDSKEIFVQLYKSSVILLKDTSIELEKAALSMYIINYLSVNKTFVTHFKHEMLNISSLLDLTKIFAKREVNRAESIGRLKNMFYEKHSETINIILDNQDQQLDKNLKTIVDYLEEIIECGGYGCLYWILKIMNKIIKLLTLNDNVAFDINSFINRVWREIEELKTNNQIYSPCMEEFTRLITHEALFDKPEFNNTVILFCNKIIENGCIKSNPLHYLARELNGKEISKYGHLVYVLGELLFYCPVSRKDERITDNLTIEILRNTKYHINCNDIDLHYNFEIQYEAILTLSRISDSETLNIITSIIVRKIDDIFKHKVRYHGNSQLHRTIQTGLQHLLFILLLNPNADSKILNWCLHILGKLPHQHSVRICLEWYTTICFYIQEKTINEQMLDLLKSKNVPVSSQFIIMYWLLKHKISNSTYSDSEYEFVLDTFLSHTMGQLFTVRLHAQYLSTKLHEMKADGNRKFDYTIEVINRALTENSKDKTFMKLKEDYFVNDFDVIANLTPYFLYYYLPNLCESNNNETNNLDYVTQIITDINKVISSDVNNAFKKEWTRCRINDEEMVQIDLIKNTESKTPEESDKLGTIQKKYIPWKNMSDVNVYETNKKRESPSDLIVVASLIDKLPNLGGMARTSEVFGVKTYVIDSLRHLQDKQFQGLSVSAERWIDVEEIRPGQPLKDYLNKKKADGYAIVAAEQTSTGSKLQSFKFPRKTLLLLGHEKEGIPCDLLPMMDHCVEIPQQGFVRSLNVHVTAAIFVWEYARQNLL